MRRSLLVNTPKVSAFGSVDRTELAVLVTSTSDDDNIAGMGTFVEEEGTCDLAVQVMGTCSLSVTGSEIADVIEMQDCLDRAAIAAILPQ